MMAASPAAILDDEVTLGSSPSSIEDAQIDKTIIPVPKDGGVAVPAVDCYQQASLTWEKTHLVYSKLGPNGNVRIRTCPPRGHLQETG